MDMQEKLAQLENNEEFVRKLAASDSVEEMHKLFAENGVEVPLDKFKEVVQEAKAKLETSDSEELSDSDLEQVAGGSVRMVFLLLQRIMSIMSARTGVILEHLRG